MKRILIIFYTGLLSVVFAGSGYSQDYCFEDAGELYGVSPTLLWAISKQESGFNRSAINFNKNGTYDYGHMQINSWWADRLGEDIWTSLRDPCQCTKVGAWILAQCIREHGYVWKAIGCYNAKNEAKRVRYAWKIYRALNSTQ